ncbi:amino acid-binding protein [alpha proteobacterium AAP81b]|nr:amino acid-binding protein [alpha proteobacterium AAP81b]
MDSRLILTVVGSDRPGLTDALARAVLAADGNWLESHLARLGGKYVGSVLVEVPAGGEARLRAAVAAVDAAGLTVTLIAAGDDAPAPVSIHVTLTAQDRPGIVREFTAALAPLAVNIDALRTSVEPGAWSGAPLFRAEALLRLPESVGEAEVAAALEAISAEIMVDFDPS